MDKTAREKLLYRRQYLYGPKIDGFPTWKHVKLPNGSLLAVHPELDSTEHKGKTCSLVLLGYLLDPEGPEKSNADILADLAGLGSTDNILRALDNYGGRYVFFIFNGAEEIVVNDAGGLRSVYHYRDEQGHLWLAPQPGLIAQKFGLKYSTEADAFLHSETILKYQEPWWPGVSSPYTGIEHLLPNHSLNLKTGEVKRYWPREHIVRYSPKKGAQESTRILRGVMKAANNRFKMAMALTGGYDSRIVFAASKAFIKNLVAYTMIHTRLTDQSNDIQLARRLAEYADIPYKTVDCKQPMDRDFEDLYTHNIDKAYQSYGTVVYGRFKNLEQDRVVIKSVVNEICRCFYYRTGVYPFNINIDYLCHVSKLGHDPLVQKYFAQWVEDARVVDELGYKLLDFFYWENRNANWQAMSQLEFDLAHEEFTPFAHRKMLSIILGVNHRYRCMPKNTYQRMMVDASWPELSQFPYNPGQKLIKKPWYEGPWMTAGRWIKYRLLKKKR
jgi:hypothetical protein